MSSSETTNYSFFRWFPVAFSGDFIVRYGSLVLLVLQNTFLVVFMAYSRTQRTSKALYASSTAVVTMEVVKFLCCMLMTHIDEAPKRSLWQTIEEELFNKPREMMKLAVPSVLYSIQNNLLYYALSHLDAATFQVGYQVKILTTALFSVSMLGKSLSCKQWLALVLLTVGVSLTQLSTSTSNKQQHRNTTFGFLAVLAAAVISGFSGVYFEKILKNSSASIWIRNLQMGTASIFAGLIGIYLSGEASLVVDNGFFHGYNWIVWLVIVLQAIGGLIVAVVVKYTDNILKGFAASFSMVTSCLLSYWFLDFQPSLEFLLGATLVNVSMFMYSYAPSTKQEVKNTDKDLGRDIEKDQDGTVVSSPMSSSYIANSASFKEAMLDHDQDKNTDRS